MTTNDWALIVSDLDRCQHGRHEGDKCSDCGGPSVGNPHMGPDRTIGYDLSANPIVVPAREERHKPEAWRRGA